MNECDIAEFCTGDSGQVRMQMLSLLALLMFGYALLFISFFHTKFLTSRLFRYFILDLVLSFEEVGFRIVMFYSGHWP